MKKILFITNNQFGYSTDYYKYCEYLRDRYDVYYLCFNKNLDIINLEGVKVKYVNYNGPKLLRGLRFLLNALKVLLCFKGIVFIFYFKGFNLFKLILPYKKMHLDIRTLSVNKDIDLRNKENDKIRNAAKLFDSVSAISNGVIEELNLNKKVHLLPLGADVMSDSEKNFDNLDLLYVGTLVGRDIIKTVEAVNLFKSKHPDTCIHYDIIGVGDNESEEIRKYIEDNKLSKIIQFYGRIPHTKLKPFFEKNNIGVSFVPIKPYYENQPPTKTFEYAFSGLYSIATRTFANTEIINDDNGILIEDSKDDFVRALENISENHKNINSSIIRNSVQHYSWLSIVDNYLEPILNEIKQVS